MKGILTTGLVLLALAGASASFAQSKRTYDDDIYYNSKKAKTEQQDETPPAQKAAAPQSSATADEGSQQQDNGDSYTSSGNNYDSRDVARDNGDDYVNYEDDYYYSTRINRFNNPFYNRGYYSTFNNPYWYDPYWVDPYWGWSPWTRPGITVSFGGGPYWSSYWGWQSWYGCSGFNSYYGYSGYGLYGGYYSGYWNGYYAGLYNNYGYGGGRYRTVTYGPRYSLNASNNNYAHGAGYHGFRREAGNGAVQTGSSASYSTPRANGMRGAGEPGAIQPVRDHGNVLESPGGNGAAVRSSSVESGDRLTREPIRNNDAAAPRDRGEIRSFDNSRAPVESTSPRNGRWENNNAIRSEQSSAAPAEVQRQRGDRGGFFGRSEQQHTEAPVRSFEQPRTEQRAFSQPRFEQRAAPAQRMEAPSRSFGGDGGGRGNGGGGFGGGGRSSGGGGGGGGGFRGGRR